MNPRRRTILFIALTALLTAYIAAAVPMTRMARDADRFEGVDIVVRDSAGTGFINADYVNTRLGNIRLKAKQKRQADFNTLRIEHILREDPNIETATAVILNNGVLRLDIEPMRPVARVFDGLKSYYINRSGKRIPAIPAHRVDVPVVSGNFTDTEQVTKLLPMFDWLRAHPDYDALVTGVSVDRRGDIIVTPAVVGHVINLGDTADIPDKFERLSKFYHNVMPVKGWQFYDTLSVKWRGQVVASRRIKHAAAAVANDTTQFFDDLPDDGTMLTTTTE